MKSFPMSTRGMISQAMGREAAGFSPLSLSPISWARSSISTLYQDSAGATPVTGAGQDIGAVDDQGSVGGLWSQITGMATPTAVDVDGRIVIRGDAVDDALIKTLPDGSYEAWVDTPYGHYKTQASGGLTNLPLNDMREYVVTNTLTNTQRDKLSVYFSTDRKTLVWMSPDTTVENLRAYVDGIVETKFTFIGANGVSVDKFLSANSNSSFDLALDGLTAPVAVVVDSLNTGINNLFMHANQLTGSLPDMGGLASLNALRLDQNQLTGPLPDISGLVNLTTWYSHNNQHTGPLPDISGLVNLTNWQSFNNQHTGVNFTTAPFSLGTFRVENNLLTQSDVDQILAAFVAGGRTSAAGTCDLRVGGTGNAAPSAAGIADKNTLISRGWTVMTN